MAEEEKKKVEEEVVEEELEKETEVNETETDEELSDEDFIKSLQEADDELFEDEETEEQKEAADKKRQTQEQKNAEEARKRREAEAKKQKEAEDDKKEEAPEVERAKKVDELGKQLKEFHDKYPDIDIAKLDEDKDFKNYLEGKVLGKKNFTSLYEDYVGMVSRFTNKTNKIIEENYQKSKASSGSARSTSTDVQDVYSEDELAKISQKLPFMSRKEAERVTQKLEKSIAFYEKGSKK